MRGFGPPNDDDLWIATISGLLAWMITLALKAAFSGL
jgi:hypothetical protein